MFWKRIAVVALGGVFLCQSISGVVIGLFPAVDGVYPLAAYRTVFALQALLVVTVSVVYLGTRDPGRASVDLPKN